MYTGFFIAGRVVYFLNIRYRGGVKMGYFSKVRTYQIYIVLNIDIRRILMFPRNAKVWRLYMFIFLLVVLRGFYRNA